MNTLDTLDFVRRARNLLNATRPIPSIINQFIREGASERIAWSSLEDAASKNFKEAVDQALVALQEGKGATAIKRNLMMKKGFSWVETNKIFEEARQLWVEEELEIDTYTA